MLTYTELKEKPKEFLAATSLTVEEFERVLPVFGQNYQALLTPGLTRKGKPRQRKEGGGVKEKLGTDADKLLFILVYQQTYMLQTMHGLQFDLSQPQANYWIHRLLPILQASLAELGMTPERDPQAVAKSPLLHESAPDLSMAPKGGDSGQKTPKSKPTITVARKKPIPTKIFCWRTRIPVKSSTSVRPKWARSMTKSSPRRTLSPIQREQLWAKIPAFKDMNPKG